MTVHSKQPTAAHRIRVAPSDAHGDGDANAGSQGAFLPRRLWHAGQGSWC